MQRLWCERAADCTANLGKVHPWRQSRGIDDEGKAATAVGEEQVLRRGDPGRRGSQHESHLQLVPGGVLGILRQHGLHTDRMAGQGSGLAQLAKVHTATALSYRDLELHCTRGGQAGKVHDRL